MNTSGLRWATGFGWGTIILFAICICSFFFTTGIIKWLSAASASLFLAYMLFAYKRWNSSGWPMVHHRAMLLYSHLAGLEMNLAQNEGRDFDIEKPCLVLLRILCSKMNDQMSLDINRIATKASDNTKSYDDMFDMLPKHLDADAIFHQLAAENGQYISKILDTYLSENGNINPEEQNKIITHTASIPTLTPFAVICRMIEATYGKDEAGRYAIALATGKAK